MVKNPLHFLTVTPPSFVVLGTIWGENKEIKLLLFFLDLIIQQLVALLFCFKSPLKVKVKRIFYYFKTSVRK